MVWAWEMSAISAWDGSRLSFIRATFLTRPLGVFWARAKLPAFPRRDAMHMALGNLEHDLCRSILLVLLCSSASLAYLWPP
jgi:hypothetical protein